MDITSSLFVITQFISHLCIQNKYLYCGYFYYLRYSFLYYNFNFFVIKRLSFNSYVYCGLEYCCRIFPLITHLQLADNRFIKIVYTFYHDTDIVHFKFIIILPTYLIIFIRHISKFDRYRQTMKNYKGIK